MATYQDLFCALLIFLHLVFIKKVVSLSRRWAGWDRQQLLKRVQSKWYLQWSGPHVSESIILPQLQMSESLVDHTCIILDTILGQLWVVTIVYIEQYCQSMMKYSALAVVFVVCCLLQPSLSANCTRIKGQPPCVCKTSEGVIDLTPLSMNGTARQLAEGVGELECHSHP